MDEKIVKDIVNDCISRQAAIERATKDHDFYKGATTPADMARRDELLNVMCWLGELPSAQPEQRWIPCSERLPEVYKDVLICWDFKGNREVLIGNMYSDGTFHGYDDEYLTHNGRKYRKAVAWMPLPEPYKGGDQDE